MFGQEVNTPVEILMGLPAVNQERHEPAEYLTDLNKILQEAYQTVRKNLHVVQERQKKQYDKKIRECNYAKGDFVYKLVCATKVGESNKLRPIFQGPYLVTKVISPALYRIDDRKKSVVVHHDKLSRCMDRQVPFWLRKKRHDLLGADTDDVANRESEQESEQEPAGDAGLDLGGLALGPLFSLETDPDDQEMQLVGDRGEVVTPGEVGDVIGGEARGNENEGEVLDEAENVMEGAVTTRRGRTVKPPDRFRDYVLNSEC
jgi:hypothetical protein